MIKLSFFNTNNPFERARLNLTIFYCAILMVILAAFSISIYSTQVGTFTRVVIERNFGNYPPRILTIQELEELREQVLALRQNLILNLALIDVLILFSGAILGYFLADKTLEPIKKFLDEQKSFIADASHELRTPLTSIISASEVALRSPKKTKKDYQSVIRQINSVSNDMSVIVNELLEISKLGSANFLIKKEKVILNQVLDEVIKEIGNLADKKRISLIKNDQEKVEVWGERSKLKQLIIILVENAIKYTPEGGTVKVSLKNSPKKSLVVEDSGSGIEPNEFDKIFKRFYRGDKSRSTPGAGLGLPIAQEIARSHKASISLKSQKGKGTEFKVSFN